MECGQARSHSRASEESKPAGLSSVKTERTEQHLVSKLSTPFFDPWSFTFLAPTSCLFCLEALFSQTPNKTLQQNGFCTDNSRRRPRPLRGHPRSYHMRRAWCLCDKGLGRGHRAGLDPARFKELRRGKKVRLNGWVAADVSAPSFIVRAFSSSPSTRPSPHFAVRQAFAGERVGETTSTLIDTLCS